MTNTAHAVASAAAESVPVTIAGFLACAAFLAGLVNQLMKIVDRIKDKPAPGEVQREAADKYVTKAECARLHALTEQNLSGLNTMRVQDAKDFAASRGKIYDEVKSMRTAVADELVKVRAEMGDMERRLSRDDEDRTTKIHDRLNEILAEVSEVRGELKKG